MAEGQQVSSTDKRKVKTGSTTNGKKRGRAGKDGAEQLKRAADKRVGRNSEVLADLLTKKALEGDLASARVLVGLAERKKPREKQVKKRRGPSLAERLVAEPEWQGPHEEKDVTDGEGVEGEG
jgi:hypothetical protein